jgi:hypothetical protein
VISLNGGEFWDIMAEWNTAPHLVEGGGWIWKACEDNRQAFIAPKVFSSVK